MGKEIFSKIFAVENLKSYFNFSRQTLALLGVLFLVVIGIAATVLVAQQQQEIRKRAGGSSFDGKITLTRTPASKDATVGQSILVTVNVESTISEPFSVVIFKNMPSSVFTITGNVECNSGNCKVEGTYIVKPEDEGKELDISMFIWPFAGGDQKVFCSGLKEILPYCGDGASTTVKIVSAADKNCDVEWKLDKTKPLSPNSDFRAYIKGKSSTNDDWRNARISLDDHLVNISEINNNGNLGSFQNCSESQPCFKSAILNSGTDGSSHTLSFATTNGQCSSLETFKTASPPPPVENNCLKDGYHECEFGKVVGECKKGINTCNVYDTWQCSFGGKDYCGNTGPNPLNCSEPCVPPGTPDTTPPPSCIDITPDEKKCNVTPGCQWYKGKVGAEPDPDKKKHFCSKVSDSCVGITKDDCIDKVGDKCIWNEGDGRDFCRARQKQGDFSSTKPPPPQQGGPPDKGGSPGSGDNKILPVPSTSCRVRWDWDPNPETSPANTSFRAYIKGESSQNSKGDPDWGYVKLKFDNGNLGAISEIKDTGSLGPLTGCSDAQPCFKSNVLNSGAVDSNHTLTFSINNPDPEKPNRVTVNCTPPKQFKTGSGGTTPPPGGGGAKLLPALNLEGFTGTYTPKRDTEALTVHLRSQAGTLTEVETVAAFSATHRHFRKLIDLPADLPDGIYELLLKGASTLRRTFGNITITKNRETFVPFDPAKPLLACDLDNNNLINISDINQIYSDIKKPKAEHKDSLADITRDGVIDIFDHNYCVQNFLKEGERP